MSKLWLLLLLVAAFQFVHSYPSEYELDDDNLSDEQETTWDIIKECIQKLTAKYKAMSKEEYKRLAILLKEKLCSNQEDYEEDDAESEGTQGIREKLSQTLQNLFSKLKGKVNEKKEILRESAAKYRVQICAYLNKVAEQNDVSEDEGDDEERGKSNALKKLGKGGSKSDNKVSTNKVGKDPGEKKKSKWGKLGEKLKEGFNKTKEFMKNAGIKVNPLQCAEKTCKSCISITFGPKKFSICVHIRFLRTNKGTYIVFGLGKEDSPQLEKKLKLGDIPNCFDVGEPIGEVCVKCLEGRAKSSQGQAKVNFCLGMLAKKYGFGVKFCAIYENKKLKVKCSPKTFSGALDDDGEIVVTDSSGDVMALDADEFEID